MVSSTTAAGTISQIARGFSSFSTRSASELAPVALSFVEIRTAFGDASKTTQSWPPCDQPAHHVGAHPAQTDHSELHDGSPVRIRVANRSCDSLSCLEIAIAPDQRVGRAVVSRALVFRELSSSGMMRCASTLPSSTPHWSNESMCQMSPCVKTLCS